MKDNSKTKTEFEKALFKLLEKKNYHNITVNEICALANITKMTFYHYYKDKDHLLAEASINLINNEYNEECGKILKRETDPEEIEYQSILATFEMTAKHYNQIQNLIYKGESFPLEIFKNALADNYSKYMSELINAGGYDVSSEYLSVFCFEGLYGSCLYYAKQLKNSKNKKKIKEENRKLCRLLAKVIMSIANAAQVIDK